MQVPLKKCVAKKFFEKNFKNFEKFVDKGELRVYNIRVRGRKSAQSTFKIE